LRVATPNADQENKKKVQHRNYNLKSDSKPDKVQILIHFLVILVRQPLNTGGGEWGSGGM
jgi:hypothetical protein